jgi:hypothetical protein
MHALRTLLALLAASAAAAASTISLPGTCFDGSGGPLLAGNVYVAGQLFVPAGQTLTIQPGAIVKFTGSRLIVDGTLDAQGTAGSPIVFTSVNDDSMGGDTNADGGASAPTPGNWDGIELRGGSTSHLDHAVIRYHGAGGWAGVYFSSPAVTATITNCSIADGSSAGVNLTNQHALPVISGCSFSGNAAPAIANAHIDSVPLMTGNSASGNPGGDFIHVTSLTLGQDTSLAAANCMGGALVFNTQCFVPGGLHLTLGADVVIKFAGSRLIVDGTLTVLGTAGHPATLTSYKDDSSGGDTNKDGNASSGAPGQWDGIEFRSGSSGALDHAVVRYHGAGGWAGAYFSSSGVTASLTSCSFEDGSSAGINLVNQFSYPVVTGCSFTGNAAPAIANARIDAVPFLSNNTATGNAGGNFIHVTAPSLSGDVSITKQNCLGGALVIDTSCFVPAGLTLSLGPDVIYKAVGSRLIVDGTLKTLGTPGHPVTLTAYKDDAAGGDTNLDGGASAGAPGQWDGIEFRNGSAGQLEHTVVRYHGAGGWAGAYFSSPGKPTTISDCSFENGSSAGINLVNQPATPVITRCNFTGNAAPAIANVRLGSVPFMTDNTASGNPGGDFIRVTFPAIDAGSSVEIRKENCLNGALVINTTAFVPADATLTLQAGVAFKMIGSRFIADGALNILGTPHEPVVFTSYTDDFVAGDTNKDGNATIAGKGNWDGFELRGGSVAQIENLLVRHAGAGGWAGLTANPGTSSTLHNVRVEHTAMRGFDFQSTAQADGLVAWDCDNGIDLRGGAFDLLRSTAAGCAGFGIRVQAPQHTGEVRDCVAWGNGADFSGLVAGQASWCQGTGLVGGTGNSGADPLFVDALDGNVRPAPGSPLIDAGDPAVKLGGMDPSTFPRFTDGNLDKLRRLDKGAYEFDNLELAVSATRHPGEMLDILTTDHADMAELWMFVGLSMSEFDAHRFGTLFVDLTGPNQILFWPKVPETISVTVPLAVPVGTQFVWQIGGRLNAIPLSAGNLSNPVVSTIE